VSLERGFRRLTALVSIPAFFYPLTLMLQESPEHKREAWLWASAVGAGLVLAGLVWAVFYVVRWIVNGFRRDPKSTG
jgi:hypothetical protein